MDGFLGLLTPDNVNAAGIAVATAATLIGGSKLGGDRFVWLKGSLWTAGIVFTATGSFCTSIHDELTKQQAKTTTTVTVKNEQ